MGLSPYDRPVRQLAVQLLCVLVLATNIKTQTYLKVLRPVPIQDWDRLSYFSGVSGHGEDESPPRTSRWVHAGRR